MLLFAKMYIVMYLFSLSYPLLLFLCFISLGIIQWRDIVNTLSHVWKFLILILPLIALFLRSIRVNSVDKIGISLMGVQFVYLIIVPLVFFFYMYGINKIRLRLVLLESSDESEFFYAHNKSIIIIAITNQWLIELLQLMMNNAFYHWIDIIVIPLLRMSIVQIVVCLVLLLEKAYYKITASKCPTKLAIKFIIIRSNIAMLFLAAIGIVSALAQVSFIQSVYYWGVIIVVAVVLLGIIATTHIGIIRRQLVDID